MPARRSRESSATLRSIPKACPTRSLSRRLMSQIAKGPCLLSVVARLIYKLFRASWLMVDMSVSHLPMPLKNCLAPRFKLPNAVSCIPLPLCLSAGWLSDHLPGSRNAAVCGKTASANSIPAYSSFTSPSWHFCSEDREQVLRTLGCRSRLRRLAVSIPLLLLLEALDIPLALAGGIEETLSGAGQSGHGPDWARLLDGGGRYAISVAAAGVASALETAWTRAATPA